MSREAAHTERAAPVSVEPGSWRPAVAVTVVALAGVLLVFWETVAFTADFWYRRRAYGHGLLLVPISLYMIWHDRAALARLVPRPQPWAAILVLGASLAWALAHVVDIQLVMQLALLAVIGTVLWTLLGTPVARRLAFPVGYLIFGIPVWSLLTPYLQDYTATASTRALRVIGVPVYLEAYYISIPAGQFVVEEVCAGLRYLLATMSIAALFAYLNLRRRWLGIVFFLGCTALSIALNWLRVVIIIWVGHVSAMDHWLVTDHLSFGWMVFAVGLVPMFLFGIWLQRFDAGAVKASSGGAAPAGSVSPRAFALWGLLGLAAGAAGPALALWSSPGDAAPPSVRLELPAAGGAWSRLGDGTADWGPRFLGADAEVLTTYRRNGISVSLYVAYYASQRDGAEVVNERNLLFDEKRWKRSGDAERRVDVGDGARLAVREVELVTSTGDRRLVWYWYRVGGARATGTLEAKLLQLGQSLRGARSAAVLAVSVIAGAEPDDARQALASLVSELGPDLEAAVDRAGER